MARSAWILLSLSEVISLSSNRLRAVLISGACAGAITWLAYAQLEYIFCTLLPLRFDGATFTASHWWWTAAVFGGYTGIGALFTAVAAVGFVLLKGRHFEMRPVDAASLSVLVFVALYVAWLVGSGTAGGQGVPVILTAVLLGIGLVRRLSFAPKTDWRTMLASPWTAPVLLLCPFKIGDYWRGHSLVREWAVSLGCVAVVIVAAFLISRVPRVFTLLSGSAPFAQKVALMGASTAFIFVLSASYARGLPPAPPPQHTAAAGNRPNVLLVIWDTARADRQSLYGYQRDTTPFLRSFAKQATVYQNAFSASDMTLSSSASIFTGLYASWHGAHFSRVAPYGRPLDGKFQTIASILKEQSYTTMAVLANCSYLSPGYRLNRGFQLYDVRTPVGSDGIERRYYLRGALQKLLSWVAPAGELDRRFRRGDEITHDALKLLASERGTTPFFLTLNYMDAHLPYLPPPPYDGLYPGKDASLNFEDLERLRREVVQMRRPPTAKEHAHITSQYDGAVAFLDSEFQKLVVGLKQLGLYDSTLIVLTADHGEALGERNLMEHAVSVYQDQVHVPLLVKYPRQSQAAVVNAAVSGVDIMPTILDVAGLPPSSQTQGRSLQHPDESRFVISESFRSGLLAGWHPRFDRVERAIVHGPIKFIHSTTGTNELYNLAADPSESANLVHSNGTDAAELSRSLSAMLASAPAEHAPARGMDKQSLDRLRSLGYVQ